MRTISKAGITTIIVVALVVLLGGTCVATYNKLVRLDQAATAQWAQVENTYQRRADLVPNLVETVKGVAWPGDWPEAQAGEAPPRAPDDGEEAHEDEEMADLLDFLGGSGAT